MGSIFVAAHPRSGSTYFCSLLQKTESLKVYLEIFHFDIDVIKNHLRGDYQLVEKHLGIDVSDSPRAELIKSCVEYIDFLGHINKGNTISYKVFPRHLPDHNLEKVIQNSEQVVIYRRNLLQSYISNLIARSSKKWAQVNTTGQFALFVEADFVRHVKVVCEYYRKVEELANTHGKKITIVNYEHLAESEAPVSIVAKFLGENTKDISVKDASQNMTLIKQDRRELAGDKLENPDELYDFLSMYGLDSLNDNTNYIDDMAYSVFLKSYQGKNKI